MDAMPKVLIIHFNTIELLNNNAQKYIFFNNTPWLPHQESQPHFIKHLRLLVRDEVIARDDLEFRIWTLGNNQTGVRVLDHVFAASETARPDARIKDDLAKEIIDTLGVDVSKYDPFMSYEGLVLCHSTYN